MGCDGIFDKVSSKDTIHIAWQKTLMEINRSKKPIITNDDIQRSCGACVDSILHVTALRRSTDNVTCVFISF
jgi:serine/threonine protein phosphatase PrpC